MEEKFQPVPSSREYDFVTLIEPVDSGFIVVAAEVDLRFPFFPSSGTRTALLRDLKILCQAFERTKEVRNARVFKSLFAPPVRGNFIKRRPRVHLARFDVVVLIEAVSVAAAEAVRSGKPFAKLVKRVEQSATYVNITFADNARRIDTIDYEHDGVFLFNFYYADDLEQNLAVWEYIVAWFQEETGLDNSVLLRPLNEKQSDYTLIDHCRWARLSDVLLSVALKPTFRTYVLQNLEANSTAAMPVLYHLA